MIWPNICLSPTRAKIENLPFLDVFLNRKELGLLENEYNKPQMINWSEILEQTQIADAYQFWPKVYEFKNAGGKHIFREIALYALTILSLPSTNAIVERVFSVMNSVRTKFRNKMIITLLNAILQIKMHFHANKTCCETFVPSANILRDFNFQSMYSDQQKDESEDTDDIEVQRLLNDTDKDFPCVPICDSFY